MPLLASLIPLMVTPLVMLLDKKHKDDEPRKTMFLIVNVYRIALYKFCIMDWVREIEKQVAGGAVSIF